MKSRRHLLSAVMTITVVVTAPAQIIDRIMAVVANHIITLSDVVQERRIRDVLAEKGPSDDKSILNDLINAQLIDSEIGQSAGVDVTEEEIDNALHQIPDLHGIEPELVRDAIRRRLQTSQFFDLRFRQAIRAGNDEIQQYYNNVFVPEAQRRGVSPVPTLDKVSEMIQKNIIEEKTVHEVDAWLDATRQRSDVEIFP